MADRWYYWHESEVLGPFSANQLADLAAAGEILPTDTVWKDGVERGVQACRVEHLFAPTPTAPPPGSEVTLNPAPAEAANVAGTVAEQPAGEPAPTVPQPETAPAPRWDTAHRAPPGRARAVAGKGAVIVGQDGTTVKFRMKCTTCGHEDSSWKTIPITRGTTRVTFFCPKCRKRRQAEVNGHTS